MVVHKHAIHWKTFAVEFIMYCTQQTIQGENFRDWLKIAKVFPLETFAVYGIVCVVLLRVSGVCVVYVSVCVLCYCVCLVYVLCM